MSKYFLEYPMLTSTLTQRGKITIPAALRHELGLKPGDIIGFRKEKGKIILVKEKNDITAAFGMCTVDRNVSLEDMEKAIIEGATEDFC